MMYAGDRAQLSVEEVTEPFLPRPPSENVNKRRSDMWPSPPASPSNFDMTTENLDGHGEYDRDGLRIPRKPAPQPPMVPDNSEIRPAQFGMEMTSNPARDPPASLMQSQVTAGPNIGMHRQFSADNILQESSMQPMIHPNSNYMSGFATTGRVSRMQQDPGFLTGSNTNSLSRNPILFPNPDRFGTARKSLQDLLNDDKSEENDEEDKKYCSHNISRVFSILYFVINFCIGCNVFCWNIWKPELVTDVFLNIFCIFVHLLALIALIYLYVYYRSVSKSDTTIRNSVTSKDERHCNNLLKMSIPGFGFIIILGFTVRLIPHVLALCLDGCFSESVLPAVNYLVLMSFFLLLIYFLIVYSKTQINKPKLMPRTAIMHVVLGCLSFLALETLSNVKIRVENADMYVNTTRLIAETDKFVNESSFINTFPIASELNNFGFNSDQLKNCTENLLVFKFITMDQYLYPYMYISFVHFCFISLAFLVLLWSNMNRKLGSRRYRRRQLGPSYLSYGFSQKSKVFSCRHTSVGLICGSVNLSVTLSLLMFTIAFVSFDTSMSENSKNWNLALFGVHNVYALLLLVTLLFILVRSWHSLRKHEAKKWGHSKIDKPLLITSLLFVIIYDLAAIYSVVGRYYFEMEPKMSSSFHFHLTLITCICNILQSIAQVVFLFDALCRVPHRHHKQQQFSSSRGSVLSLALLNLSLWLLDVVQFITLSPVGSGYAMPPSDQSSPDPSVGSSDWIVPAGIQPGRAQMFFSMEQHSQSFLWTSAMVVSNAFAIFYRFHSTSSLLNVCQYSYD